MNGKRTPETERLYSEALEHFRNARWDAAISAFVELQRVAGEAYPEIDALLADARLKHEMTRIGAPVAAEPPKTRRAPVIPIAVAALLLVGGVAAALIFMRPAAPVAAEPTTVPTAIPTATLEPTAIPTATPEPTAIPTAIPTATAEPTPAPAVEEPGALVVRPAEGDAVVRTSNRLEFILDASGSMLAEIDGVLKIDIAHTALATLVQQLPDTTNVALRSYGHRRTADCSDVELIAPMGPLNREQLIAQINSVRPVALSRTPIGLTLEQVGASLEGIDDDTLVVLVSDGDETCDGNPAEVATRLRAEHPNLRISVIGFNVGNAEWEARLRAIAENGGGEYFDATNAVQLEASLQRAVALTYRVFDATGERLYEGELGSEASLPAGEYRVEISGDSSLELPAVVITSGTQTVIEVSADGDGLKAAIVAGSAP